MACTCFMNQRKSRFPEPWGWDRCDLIIKKRVMKPNCCTIFFAKAYENSFQLNMIWGGGHNFKIVCDKFPFAVGCRNRGRSLTVQKNCGEFRLDTQQQVVETIENPPNSIPLVSSYFSQFEMFVSPIRHLIALPWTFIFYEWMEEPQSTPRARPASSSATLKTMMRSEVIETLFNRRVISITRECFLDKTEISRQRRLWEKKC